MKRSGINELIRDAKQFFADARFHLPPWAFWPPDQWCGKAQACAEVIQNGLGWDITDFGSDDYKRRGLLLFTLRNGSLLKDKKTYAEKIMIVDENQETPWHFHFSKMEDIINRGGGNLVIDLQESTETEELSPHSFSVAVDGVLRTIEAGGKVVLEPGESICVRQGLYHRFYGEPGKGRVLVGEVSQVNDDAKDNRFYESVGRFPTIDEDTAPVHLLVSDYERYL